MTHLVFDLRTGFRRRDDGRRLGPYVQNGWPTGGERFVTCRRRAVADELWRKIVSADLRAVPGRRPQGRSLPPRFAFAISEKVDGRSLTGQVTASRCGAVCDLPLLENIEDLGSREADRMPDARDWGTGVTEFSQSKESAEQPLCAEIASSSLSKSSLIGGHKTHILQCYVRFRQSLSPRFRANPSITAWATEPRRAATCRPTLWHRLNCTLPSL